MKDNSFIVFDRDTGKEAKLFGSDANKFLLDTNGHLVMALGDSERGYHIYECDEDKLNVIFTDDLIKAISKKYCGD